MILNTHNGTQAKPLFHYCNSFQVCISLYMKYMKIANDNKSAETSTCRHQGLYCDISPVHLHILRTETQYFNIFHFLLRDLNLDNGQPSHIV